MRTHSHRSASAIQPALLVASAIVVGLSLIRAPFPRDQLLQHIPTLLAMALLYLVHRKQWLCTSSFACIILFIWLHVLGARYVYSTVPYDHWLQSLTGQSLSAHFGWTRNHYDRLVHFAFGLLLVRPAAELARGRVTLGDTASLGFGLLLVVAIGALYEVFEWLLTVIMAPDAAGTYNGQQGDQWDAQKDMALAFVGALVAFTVGFARSRRALPASN